MNQKGQLSFEFLLLALIIFSLAIIIAGYHFAEQDTTNAMLIAKSEILSEINKADSFAYIKAPGIQTAIPAVGEIELSISLSENPGIDIALTEIDIANKIVANTNFNTASVAITT